MAAAAVAGAKHGPEGAGCEEGDVELPDSILKPSGDKHEIRPLCNPKSSCGCAGRRACCWPPGGLPLRCAAPCMPFMQPLAAAITALLQVALVVALCMEPDRNPLWDEAKVVYTVGSIFVTGPALIIVHLTRGSRDALTARTAAYAVWTSAFLLLSGYHVIVFCEFKVMQTAALQAISSALFLARCVVFTCLVYKFIGLVQERLRLTEAGFGVALGSRTVYRIRIVHTSFEAGLTGVAMFVPGILHDQNLYFWPGWLFVHIHHVVTAGCYLAVGVVAFRGFTAVLCTLGPRTKARSSCVKAEKRWAVQVLQLLRWATLIICSCCTLLHVCLSVMLFLQPRLDLSREMVYAITQPIIFLMEFAFLFIVTGWLRPRRESFYRLPKRMGLWQRSTRPSRPGEWTETVGALAGRSLDAGQLLDFYELLGPTGRAMEHYRPQESTTADVVRQAIIPLSRTADGGVPYTALLRPRQGRGMPERIVTHAWKGVFLHTVAAVVADALDRDEYDGVAEALADGRSSELRAELEARGTLEQSYWICAFCVNQHSSICGSLGTAPPEGAPEYRKWDRSRRDTVTNEIFPTCPCSQPKYSNLSLRCEMNKFDDLIELLSSEVPGFQQLVAVDTDYNVFTRAWCVAELHRAHFMGVPQRVCLRLNRVLDIDFDDLTIYRKLAMLTVAECEASRPEDKEDILRRIPSFEEFDEQVQEVIFGNRGLLRQQFIGFGLLEAAARTALRVASIESSSRLSSLA